ncbi:Arc/MetJ-type ribon-helix-helix transcriptional regulator [Halorubrum alkaliphilum]|uniref:Arc/MetJ-type ribon-helix-helix transcriptional regulator n=1 Tax=Halorubrum alkaliphilum TaxID=261290 RepID=A0A8T4GDC7_9EURY|nr:type II toxin-antitoxin system ParD family antitoxin [Halorubrum alkaliphilum]MBP1921491.1 Arc/MetJ-type ribon-helix-helix transcriptional regulator [Halorubrum alkaliphilum]
MPKISVEIPGELLEDLDEHVGDDGKFVNRSDAVRASIRKTLDLLDEIDERHGRLEGNADAAAHDGDETNGDSNV